MYFRVLNAERTEDSFYPGPRKILELRKSPAHGIGVFAKEEIPKTVKNPDKPDTWTKDDVICRYSGEYSKKLVPGDYTVSNRDFCLCAGVRHLTMRRKIGFGRWINHAHPKSGLVNVKYVINPTEKIVDGQGFLNVVCIKKIQKDSELFADYGKEYFTDKETGRVDYAYWYGHLHHIQK